MTLRLGIIGYPLKHSISPAFQQAAFDYCGIDARYEAWETPPEKVAGLLAALRGQADFLGMGVTVPHKERVLPLLDEVEGLAREIGAVNTIVAKSGRLVGHNTDIHGFMQALTQDAGFQVGGKTVLLLGAGGAARAVALALARETPARLTIANRTVERARALAQAVGKGLACCEAVSLGDLGRLRARWDLVVNATSVGMLHSRGEGESPIPAELVPPGALVYDLVYNPPVTPLLQAARERGARTLGGLPMLVYQGAEGFRLWTGREPPLEAMFAAARRALNGG